MSEAKPKIDNKMMILIAAVIAIVVAGGAYLYNSQKKETVSLSVGGKEITATFSN